MDVGALRAEEECFRKIFDPSYDAGFIIEPVHHAITDVNSRPPCSKTPLTVKSHSHSNIYARVRKRASRWSTPRRTGLPAA